MLRYAKDILRCSLKFIGQVFGLGHEYLVEGHLEILSLFILKKKSIAKILKPVSIVVFDVCSPVACMCLRFASGCRLCKSWAGASSQPGGQTRKQMDLFGLNPSHATSSSWPSSSNLHVSLQSRRKGAEWVCACFGGGWAAHVMLLVPSRESRTTGRNQRESERDFAFADFSSQTPCELNCADIWLLSPCWNSWPALFLCCLSSALFPFWCTLLSALAAKPALCLFVPGMSCLFWDTESPHPVTSTGCLLTVLATHPPTFMLWLSFSGRGFTCEPIIAVGSMVKPFLPQTDSHHYIHYT